MNELRRLRLNRGLTVEELSDQTKVHSSTIYTIERGETTGPRLSTLMPLAEFFGVPAGDLAASLLADLVPKDVPA